MKYNAHDIHEAIVKLNLTGDPNEFRNMMIEILTEDKDVFDDLFAFLQELSIVKPLPTARPPWEDSRYWPRLAEIFK